MKNLLIATLMLTSLSSMAKDHALVTCYNHKGEEIMDNFASLDRADIVRSKDGGFSVVVNPLETSHFYYIDRSCDVTGEVLGEREQVLLSCASGSITFEKSKICRGNDTERMKQFGF